MVDGRRANAREHLSFAAGGHFCVGAGLARMETQIGLQALFERFPALLGVGTRARRPTRTLRGWQRLPVLVGVPAGVTGP